MPAGAAHVLDARSLTASHRRLAELLRPGMKVLDVGCGTGAITGGIADAVTPRGLAVGCDVSESLLADRRRRRQPDDPLRFVRANIYALPFDRTFDIVTAARVVQWLARPLEAIRAMRAAATPTGSVVVLDYDHERIAWHPPPPASMLRFYSAFLAWRADAGMDNAIAAHLPALFESAGLTGIRVTSQHERTVRGNADFEQRAGIWANVAANRGPQMVADGFLTEVDRAAAETDYRAWVERDAQSMLLHLEAVEGIVA
jgi:SAM-dependent methyltransferase